MVTAEGDIVPGVRHQPHQVRNAPTPGRDQRPARLFHRHIIPVGIGARKIVYMRSEYLCGERIRHLYILAELGTVADRSCIDRRRSVFLEPVVISS